MHAHPRCPPGAKKSALAQVLSERLQPCLSGSMIGVDARQSERECCEELMSRRQAEQRARETQVKLTASGHYIVPALLSQLPAEEEGSFESLALSRPPLFGRRS